MVWHHGVKMSKTEIKYLQLGYFIDQALLLIEPFNKSHTAADKYPMLHPFVTEMCTRAYFCYKMVNCHTHETGPLWDMGLVHCGMWIWSIWICMSVYQGRGKDPLLVISPAISPCERSGEHRVLSQDIILAWQTSIMREIPAMLWSFNILTCAFHADMTQPSMNEFINMIPPDE